MTVDAAVAGVGKAAHVDIFNGNYGLLCGVAATFAVLTVVALVLGKGIYIIGALLNLLLPAIQRMYRFAVHYATKFFTQYLRISAGAAK